MSDQDQDKNISVSQKQELSEEQISPSSFDSAFYFDDIIKELSDAGFYANEQNSQPAKAPAAKTQLEPLNKVVLPSDNELKKELLDRIAYLENNLTNDFNHVNSKIKTLKDLLIRQKTEMSAAQKEISEKFMLAKNDSDENFNRLQSVFTQKVSNDSTKDKAFEKLYEQLEAYKKNFIKSAIKPFISDLILLHDRLENNLNSLDSSENKIFKDTMQMFKDELLEIFFRNSILPLPKSEPGEKFNPEKSNAIKKIETVDITQDGLICEVLQEGFIHDEKVFRPELVSIYKFKAADVEIC